MKVYNLDKIKISNYANKISQHILNTASFY